VQFAGRSGRRSFLGLHDYDGFGDAADSPFVTWLTKKSAPWRRLCLPNWANIEANRAFRPVLRIECQKLIGSCKITHAPYSDKSRPVRGRSTKVLAWAMLEFWLYLCVPFGDAF